MNLNFHYLTVFLLVFARMSGMILLNPLFARRNVPNQVRMGLVLALTLLISPTLPRAPVAALSDIEVIFAIYKELFVGMLCGLVFQFFYYMLFFVGDMLDMQMGLSMAKVFDPGTSIQMSVTGNLLGIIFVLYIFVTDSHLLLIKLFASSYTIVPLGAAGLTANVGSFLISLFSSVFSLAVRLSLPFVVAAFTLEVSMGILMKLIPQIHVFVINIQMKLAMGILLLLLFAQPVASFLDNYMSVMFENIQRVFYAMVA
mgnify:CR=1 FL=1